LWVADLDTDSRSRIFLGPVLDPAWSPQGKEIVFHSNSIPTFLFKIDIGADTLSPLTGPGSTNPDAEWHMIGRWSPDGSEILSTIYAGEPRGVSIMNSDGSRQQIIVPFGIHADWFPSGSKIVYVNWDMTAAVPRQRQIYTANTDGTNRRKLTDLADSYILSTPAVSPDGSQIAFVYRGAEGEPELYLMNSSGENIRQVTGIGGGVAPAWHPDGHSILFTQYPERRLYLLDVRSLEVEPLFPQE